MALSTTELAAQLAEAIDDRDVAKDVLADKQKRVDDLNAQMVQRATGKAPRKPSRGRSTRTAARASENGSHAPMVGV